MKKLKEEIVDNDEKLGNVNEKEGEDRTIKDLKQDYQDKIEKLEDASLNFIGEKDLKILKSEIPGKWKYLTRKLAYPYEYFKSIKDYKNLLII